MAKAIIYTSADTYTVATNVIVNKAWLITNAKLKVTHDGVDITNTNDVTASTIEYTGVAERFNTIQAYAGQGNPNYADRANKTINIIYITATPSTINVDSDRVLVHTGVDIDKQWQIDNNHLRVIDQPSGNYVTIHSRVTASPSVIRFNTVSSTVQYQTIKDVDEQGAIATKRLTIECDSTPPVINTTSTSVSVELNTTVDKAWHIAHNGLSVIDNLDGDLTNDSKTTVNTISTSTPGTKTQIISARDVNGNLRNKAIAVTVISPDTVPPVITVTSSSVTVAKGTVVDKTWQINNNGLKVVDNVDGTITNTSKVTVNTISTSTLGTKTQTITAKDALNNTSTKTVQVTVVDKVAPVITVNSTSISAPSGVAVDKAYQIAHNGLKVIDDVDGDITNTYQVTTSSISTIQTQTQVITAKDKVNNTSTKNVSVSRYTVTYTMTCDDFVNEINTELTDSQIITNSNVKIKDNHTNQYLTQAEVLATTNVDRSAIKWDTEGLYVIKFSNNTYPSSSQNYITIDDSNIYPGDYSILAQNIKVNKNSFLAEADVITQSQAKVMNVDNVDQNATDITCDNSNVDFTNIGVYKAKLSSLFYVCENYINVKVEGDVITTPDVDLSNNIVETIRSFKLVSAHGDTVDLLGNFGYTPFLHSPGGLGMSYTINTQPIFNMKLITGVSNDFSDITGEFIFDSYHDYNQLKAFIQHNQARIDVIQDNNNTLKLFYATEADISQPGITEYKQTYFNVFVKSIDLTEKDNNGKLICPVVFERLSNLKEDVQVSLSNVVSDDEPDTYPLPTGTSNYIKYGSGTSSNLVFEITNLSNIELPAYFEIVGEYHNPEFINNSNGVSGKYFVSETDSILAVDPTFPQYMTSGEVDISDNQDFGRDNFLYLSPGVNKIVFNVSPSQAVGASTKVTIRYENEVE